MFLSTVIADLGDSFTFVAPLTCIPLVVAVIFAEWQMVLPMAAVPAIFLLLGNVFGTLPKASHKNRLSTSMCSVALFWLICAAVSGIPFIIGLKLSFTDALFEGMAGWTGTAFTMTQDLSPIPYTLLFWRSYMQWIGGIGIIAFSIAMASSTGLFSTRMLRSESREETLARGVISAGKSLYGIYALLTFLAIGLILFTGLSLWESVNLALTTISTGGFTLHPEGILFYHSIVLELILIPIMIAGALPFKLYYMIKANRRWSSFGDEQVKLFFLLLAVGSAVIAFDLVYFDSADILSAAEQGVFMSVSALTTTGLQVVNPSAWASATLLFLTMLVFIGGASGSSAGGIKLRRVAMAYRGLLWWFKRVFVSEKVLIPFRIEGRVIPQATAEFETAKNMLVIILSVGTVFIAALCILQFHITSFTYTDVLFEAVSAFSTCGMSTGYVSAEMPVISKWIFIFLMWIGRLEVIPVLMLFIVIFRGPD